MTVNQVQICCSLIQRIRHHKLLRFITSRNEVLNTTHCFANAASGIWPENKNKIKK